MIEVLVIVYSAIFVIGMAAIVYFIIDEFKNSDVGLVAALFFIVFVIGSIFYVGDNVQTDKEFLIKKCIEHNITLPEKYKDIIKDILKDRCVEKYLNSG